MSEESYYIEEGKRYIPDVLWKRWETFVKTSMKESSVSQSNSLDCVLDIMAGINKGKLSTKLDVDLQVRKAGHTGLLYTYILAVLKNFYPEFDLLPTEDENC